MIKESISAAPYSDYVQSANVLFHFMEQPQFLISILQKKAIVPRYCRENIEYLNLTFGGNQCIFHIQDIKQRKKPKMHLS